jgi:hypothetical protein
MAPVYFTLSSAGKKQSPCHTQMRFHALKSLIFKGKFQRRRTLARLMLCEG